MNAYVYGGRNMFGKVIQQSRYEVAETDFGVWRIYVNGTMRDARQSWPTERDAIAAMCEIAGSNGVYYRDGVECSLAAVEAK